MKAIGTDELKLMIKNSDGRLTIINTLAAESFDKTHIPGAQNIPQDAPDFEQQVEAAAGNKNQPVVVYCASSECNSSEQAAHKLDDAQFSVVLDYEGGARAWQEDGNPLV